MVAGRGDPGWATGTEEHCGHLAEAGKWVPFHTRVLEQCWVFRKRRVIPRARGRGGDVVVLTIQFLQRLEQLDSSLEFANLLPQLPPWDLR